MKPRPRIKTKRHVWNHKVRWRFQYWSNKPFPGWWSNYHLYPDRHKARRQGLAFLRIFGEEK